MEWWLFFKGIVLASFERIVFEDGGRVGLEAVVGTVGSEFGAAFGVFPVAVDLCLSGHGLTFAVFENEKGARGRPFD